MNGKQKKSILYRCNEYVLIVLTGIAFMLVLAGLALYMANPVKTVVAVPLRQIFDGLIRLDSSSVIAAGIVTLFILPPALAVVSTAVAIRKREKMLALASFAVLVFLCISISLAIS